MSRPKLYEKRVEVCLTENQFNKLKKFSNCSEVTINQLIRDIIKSFLENQ